MTTATNTAPAFALVHSEARAYVADRYTYPAGLYLTPQQDRAISTGAVRVLGIFPEDTAVRLIARAWTGAKDHGPRIVVDRSGRWLGFADVVHLSVDDLGGPLWIAQFTADSPRPGHYFAVDTAPSYLIARDLTPDNQI